MRVRASVALASFVVTAAVVPIWSPGSAAAHPYVIQQGDALSGIAARVGLATSRLAALNGIANPDVIYAGQVLTTAEPTKYAVRKGDVLGAIASKLSMSATYLAALNGLDDPDEIYEGQTLLTSGSVTAGRNLSVDIVCPVKGGGVSFVNDYGYVRPDGNRHEGVDLFAKAGTPVVAPVSGRVLRYPNPSGGLAFQLYGDDGIRYYGAHLDRYGADGGVDAGTVIGYVGTSGDARYTSPHLHFEMHTGSGMSMSPYASLKRAC